MLKNGFRKALRGFTLIEISFVLLIASILIVSYTRFLQDANLNDKAAAIATHLKNVTGGVNTYISSNFDNIVAGTAISGIANSLAPTVTELKNTGYLAQNIQTQNLAGTNWLIKIDKTPTGCVAPSCDLNAIVYSDSGFKRPSNITKPDWMLASRVAGKVGGDGGTSLMSNLAVIAGENSVWTTPNPVALANAAAVVAMRTGYGSQGFSQFVRNGDSRNITLNGGLTNNGTLNNNGISNFSKDVTVTDGTSGYGTLIAARANDNSIYSYKPGWSKYTQIVNGSAWGNSWNGIYTSEGAYLNGATGTVAAPVVTGGYIVPTNLITPGTACGAGVADGTIAKASDGSTYACTSGTWVSSSSAPCVHGSWSSATPGSYPISIPPSCITITISGYGGGGGGGVAREYTGAYNYPLAGAGYGGGSTGLTTQVIARLPSETGMAFTAFVGAGGYKPATGGYSMWDASGWNCGLTPPTPNGNGQNSYLSYASSPTRTYAIFYGGGVGYGAGYGGNGYAGTGGFAGGAPYAGTGGSASHGGNGANAPAASGAPGGGGTAAVYNAMVSTYDWNCWCYILVATPTQSASDLGQPGTGTSVAQRANLYSDPMRGIPLASYGYHYMPLGWPPATGGDGYLSISW